MILDFKALFKLCFQINLGFLTVIFFLMYPLMHHLFIFFFSFTEGIY